MKLKELGINKKQPKKVTVDEGFFGALGKIAADAGRGIARTGLLGSNVQQDALASREESLKKSSFLRSLQVAFTKQASSGAFYTPQELAGQLSGQAAPQGQTQANQSQTAPQGQTQSTQSQQPQRTPAQQQAIDARKASLAASRNVQSNFKGNAATQPQIRNGQVVRESVLKNYDLFESAIDTLLELAGDRKLPSTFILNYVAKDLPANLRNDPTLTQIANGFDAEYARTGKFPQAFAGQLYDFVSSAVGDQADEKEPDQANSTPEEKKAEQQAEQQTKQYATTADQAINKLQQDPTDVKSQMAAISSAIYMATDESVLQAAEAAIKTMRETLMKRKQEEQAKTAAQPQGTSYEIGSKKAAPANNDPTSGGQQFGQRGIAGMNESKIRRKRAV